MAFSSGTRGLVGEAMSWIAAVGILAFGLVHYEELKDAMGAAIGLPAAVQQGHEPSIAIAAGRGAAPGARRGGGATVELRAERGGHFHTEAEINGRPVEVMVDTGATLVALSYEDAERAGIYLSPKDFTQTVNTANGRARVAPVTLGRVTIGEITVRDVRAFVSEPGRLSGSLLGMSFLGRLSVEIRDGTLILAE